MNLRQDAFLDDNALGRGLAVAYLNGHELPKHCHSWAQICYATSGIMQVHTESSAWLVPTTRAIWIPAGEVHWIRMRGDVMMASFYIDGASNDWPSRCRAIEVSPLLRELILDLVKRKWLWPEQAGDQQLLGVLSRLISESQHMPLELPMPRDPRALNMAQKILACDASHASTLAELTQDTGASLRTQQRLFTRETGISLEHWRTRASLQQAIVLLSEGVPVTYIADALGYKSTSAFSTAFKRQMGVPPSQYR